MEDGRVELLQSEAASLAVVVPTKNCPRWDCGSVLLAALGGRDDDDGGENGLG